MRLPVTLEIRRSRHLVAAILFAHTLVAVGLFPISLPIVLKLTLWGGLAVSLAIAAMHSQTATLTLFPDGHLTLVNKDGHSVDGRVDLASTVFPWLAIVLVKTVEKTVVLVLPVDALGENGHRQLRLWLNWKLSPESA